jgi:hypothetical protein
MSMKLVLMSTVLSFMTVRLQKIKLYISKLNLTSILLI